MQRKRGDLATALKQFSARPEPMPARSEPDTSSRSNRTPGRRGKRCIAAYFDPAASKQLKQLALEKDSSVQELLREAINDLFIKHRVPPIA